MIFVVCGPANRRFERLLAKMMPIGRRVWVRFEGERRLVVVPLVRLAMRPGYVRARRTERPVCREK